MSSLIFTTSLGSTTIGILEPEIAAMEEVSQFKHLQESQQKLEQLLQSEFMKQTTSEMKIQDQISGIDKKYEHIIHTLAKIQLQLLNISKGSSENSILGGFASAQGSHKFGSSLNYSHSPQPKMEFPRFDGSNPRAWIRQCNNYYKLMPSIPDAQRINSAIMHFDGKALAWFQSLNMVEIRITWKQFLEVVCARFEILPVSNIILEFSELKQNGSYDDYVERFEELRAYILLNDNNRCSEDYFVASFMRGLSEELRAFITMFQPGTLHHAIELGKKQLVILDAISKKLQPHDAKEEMFVAQKAMEIGIPEVEINMVQTVEEVQDLVHSIFGEGFTTMRADAQEETANKLGCIIHNVIPLAIGEKLVSSKRAADFKWLVPGKESQYFPRFLKIAVCDLILRRDWFKLCTSIEWGHSNMTFIVFLNGKKVKFKLLPAAVNSTPIVHLNIAVSVRNTISSFYDGSEIKFEKGIGIEIVYVWKYLEYGAFGASLLGARVATRRIHTIFQNFAEGIQSGLMFVVEADAAFLRCKKHTIVQEMPETDNGGTFKIEPWSILDNHRVTWKAQEVFQIIVQWMSVEANFAISIKSVEGLKRKGEAWKDGNGAIGFLATNDGYFQIEPLMVLGIRILTRKRDTVAQILLHWLKARSEFAILEVEEFLRRELSSFDPWGQGSIERGKYCYVSTGLKREAIVGKGRDEEMKKQGFWSFAMKESGKEMECLRKEMKVGLNFTWAEIGSYGLLQNK